MRNLPFVTLALSTALVAPAQAQYATYPQAQAAPAVSPADQLAAVMRRLAAAPNDLYALINAGELSMKLDDMSAAAAFFARADKIDGRNGRVKAGMGSILVRAERPGEALRYFQMSEGYRLPANRFASDRGLAHDLLGEQERAQRDYRLALATGRDDETVRRYALSLAISGDQATALAQLEPLVRRQDRAAWRVRAFVLAMTGDVVGAGRIAATMMPAGMAGGLQPFFQRLPSMTAADRAFAVHFGELRATPQRLADARLKPALPALGPDPFPLVRVAAAPQTAAPQRQAVVLASRQDRRAANGYRSRRENGRFTDARPTARRPVPQRTAVRQPVPPAQANQRPATPPPVQVASEPPVRSVPVQPVAQAPVQSAFTPPVQRAPASVANPAPAQLAGVAPGLTSRPPTASAPLIAATNPVPTQPVARAPVALPIQVASVASGGATAPAPSVATSTSAPQPGFSTPSVAPVTAPGAEVASVAAASVPPVNAVRSEDSILARIVSSITIPAEELGVAPPVRREAAAAVAADPAARRVLAEGKIKAEREEADRAAAARTVAAATKAKPGARGAKPDAGVEAKPAAKGKGGKVELASRSTTRGKAGARAEAEEDVKPRTAAARRLAEKKAAEEKAAKVEPGTGRYWVQVAGGPNEDDLPRAWAAAKKKASALQGREAYTARLRSNNRVLTGPFKTEEEAQDFVNKLSRQGIPAFTYTSEAGRKPTKLSAK